MGNVCKCMRYDLQAHRIALIAESLSSSPFVGIFIRFPLPFTCCFGSFCGSFGGILSQSPHTPICKYTQHSSEKECPFSIARVQLPRNWLPPACERALTFSYFHDRPVNTVALHMHHDLPAPSQFSGLAGVHVFCDAQIRQKVLSFPALKQGLGQGRQPSFFECVGPGWIRPGSQKAPFGSGSPEQFRFTVGK